jgi:hypothetical protein
MFFIDIIFYQHFAPNGASKEKTRNSDNSTMRYHKPRIDTTKMLEKRSNTISQINTDRINKIFRIDKLENLFILSTNLHELSLIFFVIIREFSWLEENLFVVIRENSWIKIVIGDPKSWRVRRCDCLLGISNNLFCPRIFTNK